MTDEDRYRITQMRRGEGGKLEARITVAGETYDVQRWYGSWGTMPGADGRYQHVPFAWATALQKRARAFEKSELDALTKTEEPMSRTWMTYPIPLQDAGEPVELAQLQVPTDLTRPEANRIKEMIDALVLTVEQETTTTGQG